MTLAETSQVVAISLALISAASGVIVAYVRLSIKSEMATLKTEIATEIATLKSQMATVWDIYVVEALRDRRDKGMTVAHSDEVPSPKWFALCPAPLREAIDRDLEKAVKEASPSDAALMVWKLHRREFVDMVNGHEDATPKAIIGVLVLLAENRKG